MKMDNYDELFFDLGYGATKRDVAVLVRSKTGVCKLWYYLENQQINE